MKTLLMTATVDPGDTPVVTLRDPAVRLLHYVAATMLWIRRQPFDSIVICENSGKGSRLADLAQVAQAAGKKFEFLEFEGNSGSWKFGKGYGEGTILAHALLKSKLIREESSVWKVTGRLFVENVIDVCCDHSADENVMSPGDTRFYKFDTKFFADHMLGLYGKVNDHAGQSIEVVYETALAPLRKAKQIVPFKRDRHYVGQEAGSGNWNRPFPPGILEEAAAWIGSKANL
jgi:hypothetical protein